jgi:hypothetical protein
MSTTIESLELEILSNSQNAVKGIDALTQSLNKLKNATKGLGLSSVAKGMRNLGGATEKVANTNKKAAGAFTDLYHKMKTGIGVIKKVGSTIYSAIEKSSEYNEVINLFSVSLGQYATEAGKYAESVSDIMGIDPSEWMRAQGVFMTLATGFGVAGDRAYKMSEQLTQLGYDIASFQNISVEEAMQKLQSGISGELEPLRRIGYDLSQAKLEATALELGIDKAVSSMTQAEKAQLRYYAIMTQVTQQQGDMARTLDDPANQMRVFKAQVSIAAREIGSVFIPALQAIIPYATAVAKVIGSVASIIAGLFGYEKPIVEDKGIEVMVSGTEDMSEALDESQESAKKLKSYMLGFDELNVINPNTDTSNTEGLLGGLDFELPEYDFMGNLGESKVAEIVEDMKEWLGITGEINSWSDLFETRLGKILTAVGAIGTALGAWKLAKGFTNAFSTISSLFGKKSKGGVLGGSSGMSPTKALKAMGSIGIIVGGVITMVGVLGLLTKIPGFNETIKDGMGSLGIVFKDMLPLLPSLALFCAGAVVLGKVKVSTVAKGMANAAIVIGGTEVLITAIGALMSIPHFSDFLATGVESLQTAFDGLYEIATPIGLLSGLLVTLGFATPAVTGAGVAGFAIVIGGLEAILVALGALKQIPGFDWIVNEGGEVLVKLGHTLGDFAGSIVGGFMEGVSASFPVVGEHLAGFMTNAKPFFEGLGSIDSSSVDAAKNLASMILVLTGASLLDALTSWFTGDNSFAKFGEDLASFAPNLVKYSETVKDIDADAIEASSNAAKTIMEFANNVPNEGGVAAWFAGENNIDVFGEKLPKFGEGIMKYAKSVEGLDADVVINSANAAKAIVEMADNIPNEGGVASWFAGENNIDEFGEKLPAFGECIVKYADSVKGLDASVVENSARAAKAVVEIASNVPNEGGVASWFAGENNIDTFGEKLPSFGKSMVAFANSIKGLDADVVANSANAAKSIVAIAEDVPNQGGVASWFAGENNIDVFGEKLPSFGKSIKEYADNVKGMDLNVVTNSSNAAKVLSEMANNLPNHGGVASWFAGDNNIDDFGKKLPSFGKDIKAYADYVKGMDGEVVTNSANAAKVLSEMAANLPNQGGVASWFAGDNGIDAFGKRLAIFGQSFKVYYMYIKDMTWSQINNITECLNDILDFAIRVRDNSNCFDKVNGLTTSFLALGSAIRALPETKTVTVWVNQITTSTVLGDSKTKSNVPLFASGGFPEQGQMFIAREAGAEMVGNIGRKTAVVNNDQIVASISGGVAEANEEQNALLREQNSLLRALLDKESGVYLDGKHLTNSVEKYQRERGRVLITGGVV